jgi:probable addiction module antidote protein
MTPSGVETGSWMSKAPATPQNIARNLSKAFASGNPNAAGRALGIVVRKKGLATIAKQARLRRESLYRSTSGEFSPALRTVMKLLAVLELELVVRPCATPKKAKKRS